MHQKKLKGKLVSLNLFEIRIVSRIYQSTTEQSRGLKKSLARSNNTV